MKANWSVCPDLTIKEATPLSSHRSFSCPFCFDMLFSHLMTCLHVENDRFGRHKASIRAKLCIARRQNGPNTDRLDDHRGYRLPEREVLSDGLEPHRD